MFYKLFTILVVALMMTQPLYSQTISVEEFNQKSLLDSILETVIDLDDKPLIIGKGIDLISGKPKNDCVDYASVENVGSSAKNVIFEMVKITDRQTLARELNVSTSAKFGKIASGKASFLSKTKVSKYSLHLLVKVKVDMPPLVLKRPKLHADILEMLKASGDNMKKFRKVCGDEFLSSVTRGGEFFAIITINTANSDSHSKAEAALKASYKIFSGSGEFKSALNKIKEHSEINITQYVRGGSPLISSDVDQMVKSATEFAKTIDEKNAYPYSAETSDYEMLFNFPDKSVIDVEKQKYVLDTLGAKLFSYQNKLSDVEYVLNHETQFVTPNIEELTNVSNNIAENINKVTTAASACFKNYSNCKLPTDLKAVSFILPERVGGVECSLERALVCGVEKHKVKESQACGPKVFNTGTGPVCDMKQYKLDRSKACGPELFVKKKSHKCPMSRKYTTGSSRCRPGHVKVGVVEDRRDDGSDTVAYYLTLCKIPVECRLKEFGVERWKQCRDANHGIEWNTCEHSSFGVKQYNSCEHESHGPARFKKCLVDTVTKQICPIN